MVPVELGALMWVKAVDMKEIVTGHAMAHVVDGILSTPVIVAGTAMAAVGIAVGLRRVDGVRLPYCGLMGAAFFVASLVHVPLGPSNAHLILNGLLGIVLGLAALPAIFVGLFLQALFFGYGGITVLGVNTIVMGVPAIICHYLFGPRLRRQEDFGWLWGAAVAGSAIALTCAGLGASLALSGREFLPAAQLLFVAHLPVLAVEAAIAGTIVVFLQRVKPEVLMMSWELPSGRPARRSLAGARAGSASRRSASDIRTCPQAESIRVCRGEVIHGSVYFAGNVPVKGAHIHVIDLNGATVAETTSSHGGRFSVVVRERIDYRVVADAGDGHRSEYNVKAAELRVLPVPSVAQATWPAGPPHRRRRHRTRPRQKWRVTSKPGSSGR